ncbi:hypothetical protein SAMN02745945_00845 [Peptoclostridium litorale DSM 5388]|uniref:Uncharacterized protein n=1 Tax=Peptoclostridium litorale DSM 5388 TaxID=1121324 RepID=A0A069RAW1_PEPLI|nr:hypothetical protein CLIT_23c04340 [Peptoclostridium litorale DSM 5388]SIN81650.1 hypothetical protein SAMN02745945_00845 [Peptoclostridium litorale DSM 5388]
MASEVLDGQMVELEKRMMSLENTKSVEQSMESFERLVADISSVLHS